MADNIVLNDGSGGATLAAASLSISGDTAIVQMVGCGILSGSEGSWTYSELVGGAGAVAAGVQRVTLASDDPAVVDLAAIEVLLTGIDADTDAIKTATQLIDNAISGSEMQVDVVAALPAGDNNIGNVDIASSVALDVSAATVTVDCNSSNVTVDGVPAPLNVVGGGTEAAALRVTLANDSTGVITVDGTVTATLPANSGVDIGDVDVTSVVPGTGATSLGKAEDAAHTTGDVGVLALGVRQDADTSPVGTDGDYHAPIFDNAGNLKVNIKAGAGSGGTAMTDDAAFTPGTTSLTPVGGTFDDTAPDSVDEGDAGAFRMSGRRELYTQLRDAAGNERGANIDASNQLQVYDAAANTDLDTIVGAIAAGQMQVDVVAALPAGDNNIGNVDIASSVALDVSAATVTVDCNSSNVTVDGVPAPLNVVGGGTEAAALRVTIANDSTGVVSVDDNGSSVTVDTTGTSGLEVVQDTAADLNVTEASAASALTALQIMDDWDDGSDHCEVVGAAAEDAAVSGAPVLSGGRYDTTARTLDNGDVGALALSAAGEVIAIPQAQYVVHGVERCEVQHFHVVTSTSGATVIAAPGAGKRLKILSLNILALSATATNVHLETGTTNTDCFGDSTNPIPIATDADGNNSAGVVLNWNPGGWFKTADSNESMEVVLSAAQNVLICGNYIAYTA